MYGEGGSWRLEVKMRISGFSMETVFYFTILQSWCCVQNTALELDMSTVNVIELEIGNCLTWKHGDWVVIQWMNAEYLPVCLNSFSVWDIHEQGSGIYRQMNTFYWVEVW